MRCPPCPSTPHSGRSGTVRSVCPPSDLPPARVGAGRPCRTRSSFRAGRARVPARGAAPAGPAAGSGWPRSGGGGYRSAIDRERFGSARGRGSRAARSRGTRGGQASPGRASVHAMAADRADARWRSMERGPAGGPGAPACRAGAPAGACGEARRPACRPGRPDRIGRGRRAPAAPARAAPRSRAARRSARRPPTAGPPRWRPRPPPRGQAEAGDARAQPTAAGAAPRGPDAAAAAEEAPAEAADAQAHEHDAASPEEALIARGWPPPGGRKGRPAGSSRRAMTHALEAVARAVRMPSVRRMPSCSSGRAASARPLSPSTWPPACCASRPTPLAGPVGPVLPVARSPAATIPTSISCEPEGAGEQIRLGQVQQLIADLALTRVEGRFRVAIISAAQRLNPDAQNALLKTLEEPGAATCLVLCADDVAPLLPTVVSRMARLRLAPLPVEALTRWLLTRGEARSGSRPGHRHRQPRPARAGPPSGEVSGRGPRTSPHRQDAPGAPGWRPSRAPGRRSRCHRRRGDGRRCAARRGRLLRRPPGAR